MELENRLAQATWVRIPFSPFTKTAPDFGAVLVKTARGFEPSVSESKAHRSSLNREKDGICVGESHPLR